MMNKEIVILVMIHAKLASVLLTHNALIVMTVSSLNLENACQQNALTPLICSMKALSLNVTAIVSVMVLEDVTLMENARIVMS
jgi:hypothetical protein